MVRKNRTVSETMGTAWNRCGSFCGPYKVQHKLCKRLKGVERINKPGNERAGKVRESTRNRSHRFTLLYCDCATARLVVRW